MPHAGQVRQSHGSGGDRWAAAQLPAYDGSVLHVPDSGVCAQGQRHRVAYDHLPGTDQLSFFYFLIFIIQPQTVIIYTQPKGQGEVNMCSDNAWLTFSYF